MYSLLGAATGSPLYCFHLPITLYGFMLRKVIYLIYTSIHRFAKGGVQEALVNEAFLSLFIVFRTLKRPQSLVLRIYILNANDTAK